MIGLKADPGWRRAEPGHVELALDAWVLAVVVVDAADVRDDLPGRRVDGHHGRVVDVEAAERVDPLQDEPLRLLLQRIVEGGRDAIAAGADRGAPVRDPGRAARMRSASERTRKLKCGSWRMLVRRFGFICTQVVALASASSAAVMYPSSRIAPSTRLRSMERVPGPVLGILEGRVRVLVRVEVRGSLRQGGQEGGLRDRHVGQVREAEVVRGRGLDPVRPVAVVDQVQVRLEDPLLALAPRVLRRHLHGQDVLADLVLDVGRVVRLRRLADVGLALRRLLLGRGRVGVDGDRARLRRGAGVDLRRLALLLDDARVVDHLLGDGRGTLPNLAGLEVDERGAHDALEVDAVVLPEGAVLAGDGGLPDHLGQRVERDRLAVLALEAREQDLPGPVVDVGRLRGDEPRVVEHVRRRAGRRQSRCTRRASRRRCP